MDEEFPYERDAPPTNDPSAEDTTVSSALGALLVSAGADGAAEVCVAGAGVEVSGVVVGVEDVVSADGVTDGDDVCA